MNQYPSNTSSGSSSGGNNNNNNNNKKNDPNCGACTDFKDWIDTSKQQFQQQQQKDSTTNNPKMQQYPSYGYDYYNQPSASANTSNYSYSTSSNYNYYPDSSQTTTTTSSSTSQPRISTPPPAQQQQQQAKPSSTPPPGQGASNNNYDYNECPLYRDQLGRAAWAYLHQMAALYPANPSESEKTSMKQFIYSFTQFFPCKTCSADFTELLKKNPPRVNSGDELSKWFCEQHNLVNIKLGKPIFDCSKVYSRWRHRDEKNPTCNRYQ